MDPPDEIGSRRAGLAASRDITRINIEIEKTDLEFDKAMPARRNEWHARERIAVAQTAQQFHPIFHQRGIIPFFGKHSYVYFEHGRSTRSFARIHSRNNSDAYALSSTRTGRT